MHRKYENDHHRDHHQYGYGDNSAGPTQWELPPELVGEVQMQKRQASDIDLLERTFVEGFTMTSDAPSFLRLSGVPFVGEDADGRRLHLLRVELEDKTDVASLTPCLGGGAMRFAPLPAKLASRRRELSFVYHDGSQLHRRNLAAARALTECTDAPDAAMLRLE